VTTEKQALFFNAIPLLVLAALYLAASATLAPTVWRERRQIDELELATALSFPAFGIAAAVLGVLVCVEQRALGGHLWSVFVVVVVALVPPLLVLLRRSDRALTVARGARLREVEERSNARGRGLHSVAEASNALAQTRDERGVARVVVDAIEGLLRVDFVSITLVGEDDQEARGVYARLGGAELEWWPDLRLDVQTEISGIAAAAREGAPIVVFDAAASRIVSRRLVDATGAKSVAFVPMISEGRVLGVVALGPTGEKRTFDDEELALTQALAAEGALALDRVRSASALGEALERERVLARISRRVRSDVDLEALMEVAVAETGKALGASTCLILRERGAGAVAAWSGAPEMPHDALLEAAEEQLGQRRTNAAAARDGAGATVTAPIGVFDSVVGVLAVARQGRSEWSDEELALVEAVARELGVALHTAALLDENEQRLREQAALLQAAQALSGELEVDAVFGRLVEEVVRVVGADAAECWTLEHDRSTLTCRAATGSDPARVGTEEPADTLTTAAVTSRRVVRGSGALSGFAAVLVAPIEIRGEIRGVVSAFAREEAALSPSAEATLDAFASLASLALENAEAFEQRDRQTRVQRGFYKVAAALGQPLSFARTVDALGDAATDALGGSFAAVLLPDGGRLEVVGTQRVPEKLAKLLDTGLDTGAGVLVAAARARKLLTASQVERDERFDSAWRTAAKDTYASLLAAPVDDPRTDEAGLVLIFFEQPRTFVDEDLELASHLIEAARGALQRSRLFEAERASRSLAQQLAQTGSALASELDPAAVLDEVARQAPALVRADACAIHLLEEDTELVVVAAAGEAGAMALSARSSSLAGLLGEVVQSGAPVSLDDATTDDRARAADPLLAGGQCAFLGVPLFGSESILRGVLAVYAERARAWREEEVEALLALAANASAALTNAELYQRVAVEKERNDAILANIADGIVAVDREGAVVLWNGAAERITGVRATEALGRQPAELLQRQLESEDGAPEGDREVSIRRGGRELTLSLTEAVMRDPTGEIAGRIFAFRDISADRLVEQMKSDFVSTISHELRTPLTSIYGFAETLLRRDSLFSEPERATFIGYIASESERLTQIVDALLNVARLDTGDLQVQLAPIDLEPLLADAVKGQEDDHTGNGHSFVVDVQDGRLTAQADRDKLRQILANLLDNAVKFSPAGGTVTVAARRRSDTVELRVTDEGVGVPEAERERIFRKFYRGAGGTNGAGTGLGLFIARGLVAAMGGKIWVESAEGKGAHFIFELPLAGDAGGVQE
jgi:PAS domain S-box-containing protein